MKKKNKPLVVMILCSSVFVMGFIVLISYIMENQSQKLPAVVKTDKVLVSSEVSGIANEYSVKVNEDISKNQLIMEILNPKLTTKLDNLKRKRDRYYDLINSASEGDYLSIEIADIDKQLWNKESELKKKENLIESIKNDIIIIKNNETKARKILNSYQELFNQKKISLSEFREESDDYLKIKSDYDKTVNDSIFIESEIIRLAKEIKQLINKKNLISENVTLVAAKYLLELDELNAEVSDIERDIMNLKLKAPVNGILTDLYFLPGEKINSGDAIAEIAVTDRIWIIAYGNSYSRQSVEPGQKVKIYCNNGEKLSGTVKTISPIMEKIKSLSSLDETQNTYSKIEIVFEDEKMAKENLTPGERLFVRIAF